MRHDNPIFKGITTSDAIIDVKNNLIVNVGGTPTAPNDAARIRDIPPAFYGIVVATSNDSFITKDDTIKFTVADFSIANVSGKPVVSLSTDVARTSQIGPGFYGVVFEESDFSNRQRDDVLRFLNTDFDLSSVGSKPQVALATNVARLSDIGPGFYGITVAQTTPITTRFRGINKLNFHADSFYLGQNTPNTDEVIVNLRPPKLRLFKSLTVESPTATEDITFFFTERSITVNRVRAVLIGSASPRIDFYIKHDPNRNAVGNSVMGQDTGPANSLTFGNEVNPDGDPTIPGGSWVWFETTAKSGTVTEMAVTTIFTED